jgi:Holliday junction DNA helicase RuvA
MIAFLRGKILEKHPNQVIVETAGVGSEVKLHIHTHVREDALALFGFLTGEEKTIFERLISVSGIGPKLAITVLSGLPTSDLIYAIRNGAVEQLVRIPGVGKKTAERIVLELKDKLEGVAPAAD